MRLLDGHMVRFVACDWTNKLECIISLNECIPSSQTPPMPCCIPAHLNSPKETFNHVHRPFKAGSNFHHQKDSLELKKGFNPKFFTLLLRMSSSRAFQWMSVRFDNLKFCWQFLWPSLDDRNHYYSLNGYNWYCSRILSDNSPRASDGRFHPFSPEGLTLLFYLGLLSD
jgi:hypothetical protein